MTSKQVNAGDKSERRARYLRGRRSEFWAALWLRLKGYRILATRHRTPVGEIDLIARKGNLVSFIEVKRRKTLDAAASSVPYRQRQRIARASLYWLGRNLGYENFEMSLDVILLAPFHLPRHIRGAFEPDGK